MWGKGQIKVHGLADGPFCAAGRTDLRSLNRQNLSAAWNYWSGLNKDEKKKPCITEEWNASVSLRWRREEKTGRGFKAGNGQRKRHVNRSWADPWDLLLGPILCWMPPRGFGRKAYLLCQTVNISSKRLLLDWKLSVFYLGEDWNVFY